MLPKKNRFPLRIAFKKLQESGRIIHSRSFSLLFSENQETKVSRFAFIISKKISKKAVVRNRYKRIISSEVNNFLGKFSPKVDGVFLVKRAIIQVESDSVRAEVRKVLSEAGRIRVKKLN